MADTRKMFLSCWHREFLLRARHNLSHHKNKLKAALFRNRIDRWVICCATIIIARTLFHQSEWHDTAQFGHSNLRASVNLRTRTAPQKTQTRTTQNTGKICGASLRGDLKIQIWKGIVEMVSFVPRPRITRLTPHDTQEGATTKTKQVKLKQKSK